MAERGPKPLSPKHHQAATLLGRGVPHQEAADEVGVSRRTVADWLKREDFQELVQAGRSASLDAAPSARATLEAALTATLPKTGEPDWKTRVSAARALVGADGPGRAPEPGGDRGLTIHHQHLDDEAPAAQALDVVAAFAEWDEDGQPEPTPAQVEEWDRLCFETAAT